jgi:hypothetical protein
MKKAPPIHAGSTDPEDGASRATAGKIIDLLDTRVPQRVTRRFGSRL